MWVPLLTARLALRLAPFCTTTRTLSTYTPIAETPFEQVLEAIAEKVTGEDTVELFVGLVTVTVANAEVDDAKSIAIKGITGFMGRTSNTAKAVVRAEPLIQP